MYICGAFFVIDKNLFPIQTVLQEMLTIQSKLKELTINSYESVQLARKMVTGESLKMATIVVSTLPII